MISEKITTDYWFTIEPYVYVNLTNQCALLYNTLDGVIIESEKIEIIELLREILQKKNRGVSLLTNEKYQTKNINSFIKELREKYMGDIIDVSLSKGKPVQLLPFFNFSYQHEIYKRQNFSSHRNVLENLSEISIHVNNTTDLIKLIPFLHSIPGKPTFNIIGNITDIPTYRELLSFFEQHLSPKNMICSYTDVIALQPVFENNFSYKILVHFPMDMQQWNNSRQLLINQTLPFEYIFDISSVNDFEQAEQLIEQFQIEKYQLTPLYTNDNIDFFEENVFLSKEDILSTPITIKDFFSRQSMNIFDFGKINILPNGDMYANVNHPTLGNISTDSIYDVVYKEIEEGKSWLRVRDQAPCIDCIYQWLCPPPSNYEIVIGRPNLCHVK
jgi:hypothetical protein